ncbi:MAG: FGGY-family carbohydrate kinase, partial [Verrucomicrobiota bacterium]
GEAHVTDPSNASRTLLFNLETMEWDDELLELFDIPRAVLPSIRDSSEYVAWSEPEMFGGKIRISGIAGDQQAALFGQACHVPGQAKNTYGTGCFLLMNTGSELVRSENQLISTVAWRIGDRVDYALEGSVFIAGAAIQWLRDQLGIIQHAADTEAIARSVADNGGVVFVPAFAGLGAPHWDPHARGSVLGLTRGASKEHLARAALESIALQSLEVLQAMERDSGISLTELRVDGGASTNALLMEIQAGLNGVPVVRPAVAETTALGAAYLSGLAVGVWNSMEEIAANWRETSRFEPAMPEETRQLLIKQWKRGVVRSRGWNEEISA